MPTKKPTAEPTKTPKPTEKPPTTVSAPFVKDRSGSVSNNDSYYPYSQSWIDVGDDLDNQDREGFVTFDIGSLPADAAVESAILDLGPCQLRSDGGIGPLGIFDPQYDEPDASDYGVTGTMITALDPPACHVKVDVTDIVQKQAREPFYQLRLAFYPTDHDGKADGINLSAPTLTITYR